MTHSLLPNKLMSEVWGRAVTLCPSFCAPGMAHGAQAPLIGLWWLGGDLGVLAGWR